MALFLLTSAWLVPSRCVFLREVVNDNILPFAGLPRTVRRARRRPGCCSSGKRAASLTKPGTSRLSPNSPDNKIRIAEQNVIHTPLPYSSGLRETGNGRRKRCYNLARHLDDTTTQPDDPQSTTHSLSQPGHRESVAGDSRRTAGRAKVKV